MQWTIPEKADCYAAHFEHDLKLSLNALIFTVPAVATLTCLYRLIVEVCRHVLRHLFCLTHVSGKTIWTTPLRDIIILIQQQDLKLKLHGLTLTGAFLKHFVILL